MAAQRREPARPRMRGRGRAREGEEGAGTRAQVDEFQRSRVLGAMREIVAEQGIAGATVAHIVLRAGVSRRTFYELFADREDCFLAAFEQSIALVAQRVAPPFQARGRWHERMRATLLVLLELFDEQPELGSLCVVHVLGAGSQALDRRALVVRALADAVDEGRAEARGSRSPAPLTAEGVVGAVLAVLHARLSAGAGAPGAARSAPLTELMGPLMSMIVLPYLGPAAAARELARPAPRRTTAPLKYAREDPLRDLDMRLTYRTVRVLNAISERPGASNRHVGEQAGIVDQGQTSKLLRRLQHLGLVENVARGGGHRGEPNEWRLTGRGRQLHDTIDSRTSAAGR
jgi:AcrR family transcriptional regulator/DNA-binding MarR family transcriptional regulator